jgi:hypothetical protein
MILALLRITTLDERKRIALIFTIATTALVFAHNSPWPYVFIMAITFLPLWSLVLFDRIAGAKLYWGLAWVVLGIAIATSFVRNVRYLHLDNASQLQLVARAEKLVGPDDRYFDGIGMLPNRMEPSTLWLDRTYVHRTLRERENSEAYALLASSPPKVILWSFRMNDIYPVVAPLIQDSYVQVAPNIRMAGRRLNHGRPTRFDVPVGGTYALYSTTGEPLQGKVELNGKTLGSPIQLQRGPNTVTLRSGPDSALLLPQGSYVGHLTAGRDNDQLFAFIYR